MELLIALLVLAVVAFLGFWVIGQMGLPEPVNMVARVIFGLVILLILLNGFGYLGHPIYSFRR